MPYLTPELRTARERLRKEFANRLRTAMAAAGLTQAELVQVSGVPQANLSAMMNGKLGASSTRVTALARALRVDPHDLMPVPEPGEPLPPLIGTNIKPPTTIAEVEAPFRPGSGWIPPALTGSRRKHSESLEKYRLKVRETTTIEMLDMLEEIDQLVLAGVPKDDEFWERWHGYMRREVEIREALRAKAEKKGDKSSVGQGAPGPELEGGGRGRPETRASPPRADPAEPPPEARVAGVRRRAARG